MKTDKPQQRRRAAILAAVFLVVNVFALVFLGRREMSVIHTALSSHAQNTQEQFDGILENYKRSFQLFSRMMAREIEITPDPDAIWDYLKSVDTPLLEIEGDTFDGLYMYYQGRYLYSWDTPYSAYENTGYLATERPWYKTAQAAGGQVAFTPPYMSYANHYMLTTISQMQPDGETVFAYDIKMGDIQDLVSSISQFPQEQVLIFDGNGTVLGSTEPRYLGGNFYTPPEQVRQAVDAARAEREAVPAETPDEASKAQDKLDCASVFYTFRQGFDGAFASLSARPGQTSLVTVGGKKYFALLLQESDFGFLTLVPAGSLLMETAYTWLVPLLILELLLIYGLGRVTREQKNRELRAAYVELGQIQKRLEIALSAAQKAAAVDDLTGMMNLKSFRKEVDAALEALGPSDHGIFVMIDGDRFKQVNDTYGHAVGDEVIKLAAQMIVGRIRIVDLASRLHGDEFAIFVADTADLNVAERIIADINSAISREAKKRNIPAITLSAGAVVASESDTYTMLSRAADEALYQAKETHSGGFARGEA